MLGAVVTYPSTTLNERNVSYDLGKTLPNQFLSLSLSFPPFLPILLFRVGRD